MLKKSLLLLFLTVNFLFLHAQENWFQHKASDKVTVGFPAAPKKVTENSYFLKDTTGVIYGLSILDIAKSINMEPDAFNDAVITQEFADQFLEGLAPTMPKYTFKPIKIVHLKNYPTYYIEGRDDVNKSTAYFNSVFIDGVSYNLTCILPDGKSGKNKDIFLTNISISK
jgi:hypothetical protein